MIKDEDHIYMKQALRLAKKGQSWTNPNPMVGAVIVKDGVVIGKGYHSAYGNPHAEVDAFQSSRGDVSGSTVYVTLEPCSHHGKTPPCVDALVKAGVQRVVCAHRDPNPQVSGRGIEVLARHGITVDTDILKAEAMELNESFLFYHTKKRPFIAIKFASSLDGKIATATGESQWITSEQARAYARKLRGRYQAILVGKHTVLRDNPHLGCRDSRFQDPIRIILDSTLTIPFDYQVYRDDRVIVATTTQASPPKLRELAERGIRTLIYSADRVPVQQLISDLYHLQIISVFVEGGSEVLGSMHDALLVDKVYAFQAPILIGGAGAKGSIGGTGAGTIGDALRLTNIRRKLLDETVLLSGHVRR